jgi:hypothetical protein
MSAGIKATGGGIVAPKEGDRGESSGIQQGSDVYLECYVPEDGPDKETVDKYANKWGLSIVFSVLSLSPAPLYFSSSTLLPFHNSHYSCLLLVLPHDIDASHFIRGDHRGMPLLS